MENFNDDMGSNYDVVLVEQRTPSGRIVWTALHPQLTGCTASGETSDAALAHLEEAREMWIQAAQALNRKVPAASGASATVTVEYLPDSDAVRTRDFDAASEIETEVIELAAAA